MRNLGRNVKLATSAEEHERIRDFFAGISGDYFPPLEKREGGVDSEIQGERVLYLENDSGITGALIYTPGDEDIYVDIVGVSKDRRGSLDFRRLLEKAILDENYNPKRRIRTKTWSTNQRMKSILGRVGFNQIARVHGDMHPDRISEIYEAEFEDVERYLFGEPLPVVQFPLGVKVAAASWFTGALYICYQAFRNPESLEGLSEVMKLM
ncbi:hypothetical protein GF386_04360 [Candidatus Pacearchaeota archaeon]|nr:hypothetical protein [Candidatus Pacearchaeota archaeon]